MLSTISNIPEVISFVQPQRGYHYRPLSVYVICIEYQPQRVLLTRACQSVGVSKCVWE